MVWSWQTASLGLRIDRRRRFIGRLPYPIVELAPSRQTGLPDSRGWRDAVICRHEALVTSWAIMLLGFCGGFTTYCRKSKPVLMAGRPTIIGVRLQSRLRAALNGVPSIGGIEVAPRIACRLLSARGKPWLRRQLMRTFKSSGCTPIFIRMTDRIAFSGNQCQNRSQRCGISPPCNWFPFWNREWG